MCRAIVRIRVGVRVRVGVGVRVGVRLRVGVRVRVGARVRLSIRFCDGDHGKKEELSRHDWRFFSPDKVLAIAPSMNIIVR